MAVAAHLKQRPGRCQGEQVLTTTSTTLTDETVIGGNEYYYKVYAITALGASLPSNIDSAQTVQLANAPAGVTATKRSQN